MTKTRKLDLLNTQDTYLKLQPFGSVEELNENTTIIRELFGEEMTRSTYAVLDALHRYSCVYPGLSYRSKTKIAEELEISRRTVIRACKALEEMGVIKQYELRRHNGDGRQSSNAIVFLKVNREVSRQEVTPECHALLKAPANTPKKSINNTRDTENADLSRNQSVKESLKDEGQKKAASEILKDGLLVKLPEGIANILGVFFDDSQTIYDLFGAMLRGKKAVSRTMTFESHEDEYSGQLMSVINAWKRGKVDNLEAVVYESTKRTTRKLWLRDSFDGLMSGV